MFCSTCGTEFTSDHNYCPTDGNRLTIMKDMWYSEAVSHSHCRSCGNQQEDSEQYCQHCGTSVLSVSFHEKPIRSTTTNTLQYKSVTSLLNFNKESMKKFSFIGLQLSVISFITMFIISAILRNSLAGFIEQEYEFFAFMHLKLTDFFMLLHSVPLHANVVGEPLDEQSIHIGLVPGLLVMGIIFTTIAFIYGKKKPEWQLTDRFKIAISSGLVYGFLVAVTTMIASRTVEINEIFVDIQIALSFSFFQAFFSNFTIMTCFVLLGLILASNIKESNKEMDATLPYGSSLLAGAKVFFIGFVLTIVVYTVFVYNTDAIQELAFMASGGFAFLMSLQGAAYILSLINLQTIQFQGAYFSSSDFGRETLWIFSASDNSILHDIEITTGISIFIIIGLIIPIAMFVWLGVSLQEKYNANFLKPVLLSSGIYTFLMFMFALFMKMSLSFEDGGDDVFISISLFLSTFATFIFSAAVTYLTAWFRQ